MKTILIPTDFSDISKDAINYAAGIAKPFNAKLILFHAYHPSVVVTEMQAGLTSEAELEKNFMDSLKKIEKELQDKNGGGLSVEIVCKQGLAADVIGEYAKENKVELIVMGTHGGGFVTEKLLGSVTSSFMKKSNCPVLAIGKDAKFGEIKNIVLANDYKEVKNTVLNPLKELGSLFKSHVYILHVNSNLETVPTKEEVSQGEKLGHFLVGVNHSFNYCENENVVEGLNKFARSKNADLIVMISREHSFVWNLFHEANTKKMAFHSSTPLLVLHE